jgi:hypothetical protein
MQAQAAASIRGLPLAMAAPYLAAVLKPALGGMLDADIGLAKGMVLSWWPRWQRCHSTIWY